MDRIEILTRLAVILRRLDELADSGQSQEDEASKSRDEVTQLHKMWKDLSQQLRPMNAPNQRKN
jgi:hypothetical protein